MTITDTPTVTFAEHDGATITGDLRPYPAVRDALKAAGWRWSRPQGFWYFPRSRDNAALLERARGIVPTLAALGIAVETATGTAEATGEAHQGATGATPIDLDNATVPMDGGGYSGHGWTGKRRIELTRGPNGERVYLPLTEINGYLRADLRQAQRAGQLPKGARFSVTKRPGSTISIEVTGTPQDREVERTIQRIAARYNYNDSDSMVDYFSSGFHLNVHFARTSHRY